MTKNLEFTSKYLKLNILNECFFFFFRTYIDKLMFKNLNTYKFLVILININIHMIMIKIKNVNTDIQVSVFASINIIININNI